MDVWVLPWDNYTSIIFLTTVFAAVSTTLIPVAYWPRANKSDELARAILALTTASAAVLWLRVLGPISVALGSEPSAELWRALAVAMYVTTGGVALAFYKALVAIIRPAEESAQ